MFRRNNSSGCGCGCSIFVIVAIAIIGAVVAVLAVILNYLLG